MSIASVQTIHILMRFSNSLMGIEDTIAEHRKVIDAQGAVWIGKVGKRLGNSHLRRLESQCNSGTSTYLFMVENVGRPGNAVYRFYKCKLIDVGIELPTAEVDLMPAYYKSNGIEKSATLWCKATSIMEIKPAGLREFHVASSLRSVSSVLRSSVAGFFILAEGEGIAY